MLDFIAALNKFVRMKTAFPHWIPPACSCYCVHEDCSGSQTVSRLIPVTLWNQYVNNWFPMHASAQWAPALFMRHTIAAQVPRALFFPSGEITHSCCSWTAKGFTSCCGAYRIPFLWSKAGIMEVGCSDMSATTRCSTSCRFSSCREAKGN